MNYEIALQELRQAVDRLDAVEARRSMYGRRLADVLNTFNQLDRWLSTGGAYPADWANPRHPALRAHRRTDRPGCPDRPDEPEAPDDPQGPVVPRMPGPRRPQP